jgi:AcrR family transcriptional regulator
MSEDQRITQTRRSVLTAALELIAEHGFDGATIERISERSGIARSTIYRRWPEPAQLYIEALWPVTVVAEHAPTGDLVVDLRTYLHEYAQRLNDRTYLAALVTIIDRATRDTEFGALHRAMVDARRSRAAAIVEAAKANGSLSAEVPVDDVVEALHSPFLYIRLVRHDPITPADETRVLGQVLQQFASVSLN